MKKFLLFTLALISFGVSSVWAQSWKCAANDDWNADPYVGTLISSAKFNFSLSNAQRAVRAGEGWGLQLRAAEAPTDETPNVTGPEGEWAGTVAKIKANADVEVSYYVYNVGDADETVYCWTKGEEAVAETLAGGEGKVLTIDGVQGKEYLVYALGTKNVRLCSVNGKLVYSNVEKNQVVYYTKDTVDVASIADADLTAAYAANGVTYFGAGNAANNTINYISKDYKDAETGVSFPQGYYMGKRQNNLETFYVKNCKQVIIYRLASGQSQAEVATVDADGNETNAKQFSNNKKVMAPDCAWGYLNCPGSVTTQSGLYKTVIDVAADYAGEADYVDVYTEAAWSADQVYRVSVKKAGWVAAVVFVAADGTETVYLNGKDGEAAAWSAEAVNAPGSYVAENALEARGKLFPGQMIPVNTLVRTKLIYTATEVSDQATDALVEKANVAAGTPYLYTPGTNNAQSPIYLKNEYKDAATGFTAKKGLYNPKRVSGWEYYYVKNVKAIITYNALGWQNQIYVEEIPADITATAALALPNADQNPLAKNKNFKYGTGAQTDGYYADDSVFKFVVSLDGAEYAGANAAWTPELVDAEGNPVEWSADKAYRIGVKKGAWQYGIAFVSAIEGAPSEFLNAADGENAAWVTENPGATGSAIVSMAETPSVEDIHYFVEEHKDELFAGKNAVISLVPGKVYTNLQATEFPQGTNVTITAAGEKATVVLSEDGNFIAQDALTLQNLNIDATALKAQGLITLSDTPSEDITAEALGYKADGAQDAYIVEGAITIDNCNIKNLEKSILYGGSTQSYVVKQFNLTNNMIQLCNDKETFIKMDKNANSRGTIANFTIKNNTIWNTKENNSGYFLRFANSSNAQPQKALGNHAKFTYEISNNTLIRTMTAKDLANNMPNKGGKNANGENFITTIAKNNVFYDVFRVYQYAQTQTYRDFQNNTIWWDKTSKQNNDVDRKDSNNNPLCVEENPGFASEAFETVMDFAAENCGVNFTVGASSEAAYLQAGDPRWLKGVTYVEPLFYTAEGQVGSGIEGWKTVFTEDMTVPVEVYRHYAIVKGFAGAEGYDLKVMVPATKKEGSYKVALVENGVESAPVYDEYIMTYTGVADPYYVALYPGAGEDGELYTSAVSSKNAEEGGYFCCHGFAYPADGGEGVWTYYYVTWPKSDTPVVIENATNNNAVVATPAYNLAGQKVGADYKGIVIKDGKKFMVK